jgi:hypothetical protein
MAAEQVRYPGQEWEMQAGPEAPGWSGDHLSRTKQHAASIGSLAVMVVTENEPESPRTSAEG